MACKEHFFVFGKERVAPTALGTHRVHCQHCGKNLYERLPEVLRSAETVGVLEGKMSRPRGDFRTPSARLGTYRPRHLGLSIPNFRQRNSLQKRRHWNPKKNVWRHSPNGSIRFL